MKTIFKLGLVAAILITCNTGAVRAASLVKVSLWDKGASTEMPIGLVYATPGLDMTKATMGMKVSPGAVKAGRVTFKVKNDSKDTVHEMIVMFLADPKKSLPYIDAENRVDEDKAGDKGVVSELDSGKSGSFDR